MKQSEANIARLQENAFHWIHRDFLNPREDELMLETGELDQEALGKISGLKRELVFVVGLYSTEELITVYSRMGQGSRMIVIEPNSDYYSKAVHFKNLDFMHHSNITLFADDLQSLPLFLDRMLSTELIYYLQNIRFYFTDFYRNMNAPIAIQVVRNVREAVSHKAMLYGNSVEDSLIGLNQNLHNIKHLERSKQVDQLKGAMKDRPAIVVAAGPSLNKNIQVLKKAKGRAIIIAVDTIASKLLAEGIVPDFICSIERGVETYDYFYANKSYPSEITLVAPLLIHPAIFDEFAGNLVIPLRKGVGEYLWLQDVLGLDGDHSIPLGTSCAHVAFGLATHLKASPIILVGQDLAFAKEGESTHAKGTIYDRLEQRELAFGNVERIVTEGYMGGEVETTAIWNSFRQWIELEINKQELTVINATEGGAKIKYTQQLPLHQVVAEHLGETEVDSVKLLNEVPDYPIEKQKLLERFRMERELFQKMKERFADQLAKVKGLSLKPNASVVQMQKFVTKLSSTDEFFSIVKSNWLLRHNMQPVVVMTMWKLFDIEQVLSYSTLTQNQIVQVQFLEVGLFVLEKIIEAIDLNVLQQQ